MGLPGSRETTPAPVKRSVARRVLSIALGAALVLALVLAAAAAALRFWIVPQIDTYRPALERAASRVVQAPVRIDALSAEWQGWQPHLRAQGVRVLDEAGQAALDVREVQAALSWRSLLHWQPEFSYLDAAGITLAVRRESETRWHVAGRQIALGRREGRLLDRPAMQWLLRQRSVQVRDVKVELADEVGVYPAITLTGGSAALQHDLLGDTRFSIQATPPDGFGQALTLRGELRRDAVLEPAAWRGELFAQWQDVDTALVQSALGIDYPAFAGRASARAWAGVDAGGVGNWSADVAVAAFAMTARQVRIQVPAGTAHLHGDATRRQAAARWAPLTGTLSLPRWFESADIPIQDLMGELHVTYGGDTPVWQFRGVRGTAGEPGQQARFATDGQWQRGGRGVAGLIDLTGRLEEADALAVSRFMPRQVGPGVRRWLREGVQGGRISQADVTLRGDLADFPFDRQPQAGDFQVAGHLADVTLDVLPQRAGTWPRFERVSGQLAVSRARLTAQVAQAVVQAGLPEPVSIGPTTIEIPDLHAGAVLSVAGEATGPARAFLAYVQQTPLTGFTAGFLDAAEATGALTVPLRVQVPLSQVNETEVQGEVRLAGNTIRLHPLAPPFTDARGAVTFTQRGLGARQVRARWLGGPVNAEGEVALAGGGAIVFNGNLQASAVHRAWPAEVFKRLEGGFGYRGEVTGGPDGVTLAIRSDLRGLSIALPAPLDKPAEVAWPMTVRVARGEQEGTRQVSVALADKAQATAEFAAAAEGVAPRRIGVGVGRPASLPADGVDLTVSTDVLDVGTWAQTVTALAAEGEDAAGAAAADWATRLPVSATLEARRIDALGQRLDAARVRVSRTTAGAWRADIQSRQAEGTLDVVPGAPATWRGRFERLALEPAPNAQVASTIAPAEDAPAPTLPNLDLDITRFAYHGRDLGRVRVAADNAGTDGHRWHVRELSIVNRDAALSAQGSWEPVNGGTRRRTTLDVTVDVRDAGGLLGRLGFADVVAGGSGHIKGSIGWAGTPFSYDVAGLDAHAGVALDHGRFLQTANAAGRLLGILSLQTLARTATFSEGNLFASGFAWDTLRSELSVSGGIARIDSFNLHGSSATAVLSGTADLVKETADLRAVIVPHVDASGAALLAGLAINPILGAGAFLTQWLLQKPISEALTLEYAVTGPWSAPQVRRIDG